MYAPDAARRISGSTGLVALLGDPVEHSLSPAIHNAAFAADGLDLVYVACSVSTGRLRDAVAGLDALGARGANVTIPHKEAVLPLVAGRSPEVEAVGAANTLVRGPGGWRAHNTDVAGFLAPLEPHVRSLAGGEALVLGAGGAARAVVYALLTRMQPSRLTVAARRPAQAEALAASLAPFDARAALAVSTLDALPPARLRAAALVVHTTPVGVGSDASLLPADAFAPGQIAYDLAYRPDGTRYLHDAAGRGATAIGGLPMLVAQAAAAYQLWTDRPMPLDAVHAALASRLDTRA